MTPVLTAKTAQSAQSASPHQDRTDLQKIARFADLAMLTILFATAAAALTIGNTDGQFGLALGASALLLVLGRASYFVGRSRALGWIALGAALFAVHHMAFDRMQAFGLTVYGTPQADVQQTAASIKELTGTVTLATRRAASAGASMANTARGARRVNPLIGEIAASVKQKTLRIAPLGEVVTHLAKVTQQTAASVEERAAAAESLRQQATDLNAAVQRFSFLAAFH